jgi:hypothetical protein
MAVERLALTGLLIICGSVAPLAERSHAQWVDPWITRTSWKVRCEDPNVPFGPEKKGEVVKYGDGTECAFDEAEAAAEAACPYGVDGFVAPLCHGAEPNPEWVELENGRIEAWQAEQLRIAEALGAFAGRENPEVAKEKAEAALRRQLEERAEDERRREARTRVHCGDGLWNYQPETDALIAEAESEIRPERLLVLAGDDRWRVRAAAGRNPRTWPSTLVGLARDCVSRVGESVIENPSTPFNVLVELGRRQLDDPGRLEEMAARRRSQGYVEKAQVPRQQQSGLHRTVETLLDGFLNLVGQRRERPPVRSGAVPPRSSRRVLAEIDRTERPWKLASSGSAEARRDVARAESTPPAVLDLLASDPDLDVRVLVASNPRTSPATVLRQVPDDHPLVRRMLAGNWNAPAEALEILARDYDRLVRGDVASNRWTPAKLLRTLAGDPDEEVVEKVASNPSAPRDLVERLATDGHGRVRDAARGNLRGR